MEDYILKDHDGSLFLAITDVPETELADCPQFTHCLALVRLNGDFLFGWNKWRKRYEIFGGCIETGETARQCIERECLEELGIENGMYTYLGLMKFLLMPDYFSANERIEYGALYGIDLGDGDIDEIYNHICDREEIVKLSLYSEIKGREPIAPIDEKLLEYYFLRR